MIVKNYRDTQVTIGELGISLEPGETCEVADGYCKPLRAANGTRIPPIIERLCPGLEPADEAARKEWKAAPEVNWTPPTSPPTAKQLEGQGMAPGVAEILADKAASEHKEEEPAEETPTEAPKPAEPRKRKRRR